MLDLKRKGHGKYNSRSLNLTMKWRFGMKKSLLSLLMMALVGLFLLPNTAMAVGTLETDLDVASGGWAGNDDIDFAADLFGTTTSAVPVPKGLLAYLWGTNVPIDQQIRLTITMANGVWSENLDATDTTGTGTWTTDDFNTDPNIVQSDGGQDGDDFIELTITTQNTDAADDIDVNDQDDFEIGVDGLVGLSGDINASTTMINVNSGVTIESTPSTKVFGIVDATAGAYVADAAAVNIDVAENSMLFTGAMDFDLGGGETDNMVRLGTVGITESTGMQADATNAWDLELTGSGDATEVDADITLTLTGDFSASQNLDLNNDGTADECGCWIDFSAGAGGVKNSADYAAGEEADSCTNTTMTWVLTDAQIDDLESVGGAIRDVMMVVSGSAIIPEQTPSLAMAIDYDEANYLEVSDSGDLAALEENGATDTLAFVNAFRNQFPFYLRVSNLGAVQGAVTFSIWDDQGNAYGPVDLADIVALDGTGGCFVRGEDGMVGGEMPGNTSVLFGEQCLIDATPGLATYLSTNDSQLRVRASGAVTNMRLQGFSLDSSSTMFSQSIDAGEEDAH
jgi:hypothetical protein